jgi:mannose-6-phosphate isomerase-like protein (cupin superfamily)
MTSPDFIFMLTRADRTISDASARLAEVLASGVKHIGFKDVGLPPCELRVLASTIRAGGAKLYLEVVSLDAESEAESARMAVELGVDCLLGGTRPEVVLPVVAHTGVRYYPFVGRIEGHPSRLTGSPAEIVESAKRLAAMDGVHGLDLLAYRFDGYAPALISAVCAAVGKPVVVAGSIDRVERIAAAVHGGAAGITVGTAALNGVFPAQSESLNDQIAFIAAALSTAAATKSTNSNGSTSMDKVNLASAFAKFSDHWSPKVAGDVGDFQVKLAKFTGAFHWHHHEVEDELFLVVSGRLRMGFRDRAVDLDPGEFIIVPHGVEHCPEALTDECHVMLLEPSTTLNTGNVENERTVRDLGRLT